MVELPNLQEHVKNAMTFLPFVGITGNGTVSIDMKGVVQAAVGAVAAGAVAGLVGMMVAQARLEEQGHAREERLDRIEQQLNSVHTKMYTLDSELDTTKRSLTKDIKEIKRILSDMNGDHK